MDSLPRHRVPQICILIAATVLLGIFVFAAWTVVSFRTASDALLHVQDARLHLADALADVKDSYDATRTFMINGDERALDAREKSDASFAREMTVLRSLARGDSTAMLDRLEQLTRELNQEYDALIAQRRAGKASAQIVRAAESNVKRLAEDLKVTTNALQSSIMQSTQAPLAAVKRNTNVTLGVLAGGLALDVGLVAAVLIMLRREARARAAAARELRRHAEQIADARDYAENIVDTVREPLVILTHDLRINSANRRFYETFKITRADAVGGAFAEVVGRVWAVPALLRALNGMVAGGPEFSDFEIGGDFPGLGRKVFLLNARPLRTTRGERPMLLVAMEDISERKLAESRLQELNGVLRARSAELEAANRELEAFSYSVSHDLRAPLRHIDFFSGALQKQLAHVQLDAKAQRHLASISASARNMGQLIDDLLSFARISRAELRRTRVRLDELIEQSRQELHAELTGRQVAWAVGPLPDVEGDPALLKQVFANLLSNALKYTRGRAEARIEISAQRSDQNNVIIAVRDNGAGFDMKYADKLFGVFQRLHSQHEFEGTGVGLANVRRIVERHGGRVWGEGAVDRGATFFVALPAASPAELAPAAL